MNDKDKIDQVENVLDGKRDDLFVEITIKRGNGTKVLTYTCNAFGPFTWNSNPDGMIISRSQKLGLSGFQYYPMTEDLKKRIK